MTTKTLLIVALFSFLGACSSLDHKPQAPENKNIKQAMTTQKTSLKPKTKPIVTQTGRYTALAATPTPPQRELLDVVISVTIPHDFQTVGEATRYLLRRSGYQLADNNLLPLELLQLFVKPLPEVHRHLGPMTLRDALNTLVTPAFEIVADSTHRRINYRRTTTNHEGLKQ